jgi:enoyl-CoA hydratase/carnithine racemase
MKSFDVTGDSFNSRQIGNNLIVRLKGQAMDILTDLETSLSFRNILEAAQETDNLHNYIQIKDSEWDSHADVDKLGQLDTTDDEFYTAAGRTYGYRHDMLMARFRNTMGYCILALKDFGKPMVAGLQGNVSAEYLGLTLLFDSRIAMPDTTISFDNVRTGIPSSPTITLLMPGFIGTGKTLALANQGAVVTAQEAQDLGLISEIVEQGEDLTEACINGAAGFAGYDLDIVELNRQHILPSTNEVSAALEAYYQAITLALIRRRART